MGRLVVVAVIGSAVAAVAWSSDLAAEAEPRPRSLSLDATVWGQPSAASTSPVKSFRGKARVENGDAAEKR